MDDRNDPNPDLTGNDPTNSMKGRMARRPERWFPLNGPAIVIGHEWDEKRQCDSYWLSYGGSCTLVPGSHIRHAEMEELMAEDTFFSELKKSFADATKDTFPFTGLRDVEEQATSSTGTPHFLIAELGVDSGPSTTLTDAQRAFNRGSGTIPTDLNSVPPGQLFGTVSRSRAPSKVPSEPSVPSVPEPEAEVD